LHVRGGRSAPRADDRRALLARRAREGGVRAGVRRQGRAADRAEPVQAAAARDREALAAQREPRLPLPAQLGALMAGVRPRRYRACMHVHRAILVLALLASCSTSTSESNAAPKSAPTPPAKAETATAVKTAPAPAAKSEPASAPKGDPATAPKSEAPAAAAT